jgi:membrane protein implicated in regulation of membrane protease activity
MAIAWLIIFVVGILAEFRTSAFFALFISLGAIFGFVAAVLGANVAIQTVGFALVTIVSIFSLRRFIVKRFHVPTYQRLVSGIEGLVGETGIVVEDVKDDTVPGRVRVRGDNWLAITYDPTPICVNEKIAVVMVEDGKLVVSKGD